MDQRGYSYKFQQVKGENAKMPYIYNYELRQKLCQNYVQNIGII